MFQSPKSLSSLQNHSVSCKMNLDDDKGKYGKAVFRWEKLGVDMAHDWNKASKQESFYEHRISQNSHDRSSRFS